MSKLVRDKIPDIIRARGGRPITRIADNTEYLARLIEKLAEEAAEVRDADDSHRAEELADTLEVVYAIADAIGVSRDELERVRKAKAAERGRFAQRIIWLGNEEIGQ